MYTPNNFVHNLSHPQYQNSPYLTFTNSHLDQQTSIQGFFGNQHAATGLYMPYTYQTFGEDSTNVYTNQGLADPNPYTNKLLAPPQNLYLNEGFAAHDLSPFMNPYTNQGFAADPTNQGFAAHDLSPFMNPHPNQQFPSPTNPYINEGFDEAPPIPFMNHGNSCMNQGVANATSQQHRPQPPQQTCSHWTNKPRMHWTKELHQSFLAAVNELGGLYRATPKAILDKMNVTGVTATQVKSHLQKARNLDRSRMFEEEYAEMLQPISMIAPESDLFQQD